MFQRILVPLDGSLRALQAVPIAARIAPPEAGLSPSCASSRIPAMQWHICCNHRRRPARPWKGTTPSRSTI